MFLLVHVAPIVAQKWQMEAIALQSLVDAGVERSSTTARSGEHVVVLVNELRWKVVSSQLFTESVVCKPFSLSSSRSASCNVILGLLCVYLRLMSICLAKLPRIFLNFTWLRAARQALVTLYHSHSFLPGLLRY